MLVKATLPQVILNLTTFIDQCCLCLRLRKDMAEQIARARRLFQPQFFSQFEETLKSNQCSNTFLFDPKGHRFPLVGTSCQAGFQVFPS